MHPERIEIRVAGELRPLMPRFIANRHADVLHLESALEQCDHERMRQIGHMLKGAGGGYGFAEISRIGDAIECAAKASEFDMLKRQIEALKRYLECLHIVYK
ncbi:MAG TPA: Hpt domain-containing protein [Burkholderiales bacterium]|jgi:HPt (histidine-containing phosphotransfer) domain-containing protein|nr:Hpt domain-containing protein [Burkholderiales bacterium]